MQRRTSNTQHPTPNESLHRVGRLCRSPSALGTVRPCSLQAQQSAPPGRPLPLFVSDFGFRHSGFRGGTRRGFTLVELFVTIAVLIILMGLMVDLANRVRRNSANRLTRQLLRQVDLMMEDYVAHNAGRLPDITPLLPPTPAAGTAGFALNAPQNATINASPGTPPGVAPGTPPGLSAEASLQLAARRNNADFIRLLRSQFNLSRPGHAAPSADPHADPRALLRNPLQDVFAGLPLSLYDELTLHDPWGSPLVFMPAEDPRVGTAPGGRFFFFSAGPDRQFLTREDNLYSYELPDPELTRN